MKKKLHSILIVDDDAPFRDAVKRMLEAAGHQVAKACDGKEAADAIARGSFDLLITDVLFPGRRTIEALVERAKSAGPACIIGVSHFARTLPDYYLQLTEKLGVRAILSRPLQWQQLSEAMEEAFAGEAESSGARQDDPPLMAAG